MKRILGLTVILIGIYFFIQIIFSLTNDNYYTEYEIIDENNKYTIQETLYLNDSVWPDNYFININIDNINYSYEIYDNFNHSTKIVDKVKFYSDETYKCLFVKFKKSENLSEVRCFNGEYILPYHSMQFKTDKLENFISGLKEYGYDQTFYIDERKQASIKDNISVYESALNANTFIGIYSNDNIYRINEIDKISSKSVDDSIGKKVFLKDQLIIIDDTANYIQLHMYSIINNSKRDLVTHLSTDDYKFIGAYNNKIYFYDEKNKIEYEVNIDNLKIINTKTNNYDIKYFDRGEWNYDNISDIDLSSISFGANYFIMKNDEYNLVIKIAKENGYYYYFKKVESGYNIYRGIDNPESTLMMLFNTDDYKSIKFIRENIYYIKNNELRVFSDKVGEKSLVKIGTVDQNIAYHIYTK